MKFSACTLAAVALLAGTGTDAFLPSNKIIVPTNTNTNTLGRNTPITIDDAITTVRMASFLDNIPNPFADEGKAPRPPDTPPPMMSNDAEALFSRARSIIASDLGLSDPSFLADDDKFQWVGPNVISTGVLAKDEYLAAGKFFNLRSTFPDLDYRAHDFRLDPRDPLTVRFTARTVGTMRGELRLRSETLEPNGVRMQCPPEAISMTFDRDSGKLTKLCSGFVMDRLVGNTGGLCGVQAAATVAGKPPSEWEVYPPSAVLARFFGRSVKQLQEPSNKVFLAPFPETVMIQLSKGVLAAEIGTKDPDLLGEDFTFCGPIVGPLDKRTFLEAFEGFKLKDAFPDLQENYANFRVDPYDPYRVWYDTKGEGTWTGPLNGKEPDGSRYIGPPEIGSMTFDDNGFCTRLTAGAVVDPTDCNTGGLGGVFGIFYATGNALPGLASRPLPQIIARAQKAATSIFNGKSIDDFGGAAATPAAAVAATTTASAPPAPPAPEVKSAPAPPVEIPNPTVSIRKTMPIAKVPVAPAPAAPKPKPPPKVKAQAPPKSKSSPPISIDDEQADPVSDAFSNLFGGGSKEKSTPAAAAAAESKSKPKPKSKAAPPPAKPKAKPAPKPSKPAVDIESQKLKLRAAAEEREKAAAEKKAQAEQKRKEMEESRLRMAEEKKALAEQKKKEAEEAKAMSADQKKAQVEQKKKEAEEARVRAAEERKALAEQKKAEADQKKIAAVAANQLKKKEAEEKKAKANAAAQAESLLDSAKRGATISLGFFGFGSKDTNGDKVAKPSSSTSGAPKGVPSLTKWSQNNDGSVTGLISGSNAFPDGESITTSPMKTSSVEGDSVVVTLSGSRYYLDGNAAPRGFFNFGAPKASKPAAQPEKDVVDIAAVRKQKMEEQKAAAAAKKAEFDAARKAKLDEAAIKAAEKKAALQAQKEEAQAKREAAAAAKSQASQKAASMLKAKKGSGTISLQPTNTKPAFSFFGGGKSDNNKSSANAKANANPPAGVPVINKFKQNRDGSVTGFITGSAAFREGERVTTSKLAANQTVESGNVVKTVSGSKYFLK